MIGLIITINKYNNCFSHDIFTFNLNSIDDVKDKLISTLVDAFKELNIDFPLELLDFEYIWFDSQYTKLPVFTYKIYDNSWLENIWDDQDIYTDVLSKLYELEINNPPNFSSLYNEPELDDNYDNYDNDNNKPHEFEALFNNILSQS
jgi:hypothetical protein